jgi:hypothetical protein
LVHPHVCRERVLKFFARLSRHLTSVRHSRRGVAKSDRPLQDALARHREEPLRTGRSFKSMDRPRSQPATDRPEASCPIWIRASVRRMASRKRGVETGITSALALIRCCCSTSSVISNGVRCGRATSLAVVARYKGQCLAPLFPFVTPASPIEICEYLEAESVNQPHDQSISAATAIP